MLYALRSVRAVWTALMFEAALTVFVCVCTVAHSVSRFRVSDV